MLREISSSIEEIRVRRVLWILGALFSLFLLPAAVFGLLFGAEGTLRHGEDLGGSLVVAALGTMSIVGIVGAWARVILSNERFRRSSILRTSVAFSIALGVVVAVILSAGFLFDASVAAVLMATVALIGTYLFCATIGVKDDAI